MTTPNEGLPALRDTKHRHYWVREDFDHLMGLLPGLLGLVPADEPYPGHEQSSHSLAYPKNIEGAYQELRFRGLKCDAATLMKLVEDRVVRPGGELSALLWSKEDIDAAAEWLNENEQWSPWTHFCWVCNLRYGQCVKARRVASARYNLRFDFSFDVLGLVTRIDPATEEDGYAYIRFYPESTTLEPKEVGQ